MKRAVIEVQGASFGYRGSTEDAIRNLSLHVAEGCLFGLLGPNGSGKTTLISLLVGLLTAREGSVRIRGQAPCRSRTAHTRPALVPQEYAFYPRLTVAENLALFAGVQGVRDSARTDAAVEATGLGDFVQRRAGKLSGGLKRRLNLAIGLLDAPRILLLDEPTVGIDPQSRNFILESIRAINAAGTTVIYTSHYMEEVQALCDRIAILDQGRVIAEGDLDSLLGQGDGGSIRVGLDAEPDAALRAQLDARMDLTWHQRTLHMAHGSVAKLRELLDLLARHDVGLRRVRYGDADLEELFLRLTGRQLRD